MSHRIVLIGAWFGPWPVWIDFFMLSCGANVDIDWLIFSDQLAPESTPDNVAIITSSFEQYKSQIGAKLSLTLHDNVGPYKMCDFKPALGYLHYDRIKEYDFFGFTDFDVIYGDIRSIYHKDVLDSYDALSTNVSHVSGHLFLMRNTSEMRKAFMAIPSWRKFYQEPGYRAFDEHKFFEYFKSGRSSKSRLLSLGYRRPYLFKEAYSTPWPATDMRWYWRDGRLSNEFYPNHSFLYLHFMTWQSNKWYHMISYIAPGTLAPWQNRSDVVQIDWRKAKEEGFMMRAAGIQAIEVPPYP